MNGYGSGDLYARCDLVWDGPIEGALRKIASTAGYHFRVEGKEPANPVNVHLKIVDRPCLVALRELGLQTGDREGIIVNEGARSITLKYLGGAE